VKRGAASATLDWASAASTFQAWWRAAPRVLIGAGAGLSAAAGIDYTDQADFARVFPALARRGLRARYELIGFDRWTPAQHWAYWATHVNNVRFGPRPHPVYARLRELTAGKDTFVITSNVDAMFTRNGFDPQRFFTPQGDYAAMQCRQPCRRVVWPSQPAVERLLGVIEPNELVVTDATAIPACPHCGGEVFLNVRLDAGFVSEPYREQAMRLDRWLRDAPDHPLLIIEIGAGFNTPSVVRWPIEALAAARPSARFVRVNRDHAEVPEELDERALSLAGDAGEAIEALWRGCVRSPLVSAGEG
jgi:NAD-dependent SIR2 family protein deacetylase